MARIRKTVAAIKVISSDNIPTSKTMKVYTGVKKLLTGDNFKYVELLCW